MTFVTRIAEEGLPRSPEVSDSGCRSVTIDGLSPETLPARENGSPVIPGAAWLHTGHIRSGIADAAR